MTTSALFAGVRSASVRGSRIGSLLMGVLLCGPKARVGRVGRSGLTTNPALLSFGTLDQLGRATADHDGRGVGGAADDRRHHGRISHTQSPNAVDTKVAIHHRIRVAADLGRANRMSEAGRRCSRQVHEVSPAGGSRTRNHLGLTNSVKGSLTTQLPRDLDRAHASREIMLGTQIVAFDDGRSSPIGARKTYLATTGWLDQRWGDGETFLRRCAEPGNRLRRRYRQLLQDEIDVRGMSGHTAREIDLGLDCVTVRRAIGHLALVAVNHPGKEDMVLKVLPNAPEIDDWCDANFLELLCVAYTRQHQERRAVNRAGRQDHFSLRPDGLLAVARNHLDASDAIAIERDP